MKKLKAEFAEIRTKRDEILEKQLMLRNLQVGSIITKFDVDHRWCFWSKSFLRSVRQLFWKICVMSVLIALNSSTWNGFILDGEHLLPKIWSRKYCYITDWCIVNGQLLEINDWRTSRRKIVESGGWYWGFGKAVVRQNKGWTNGVRGKHPTVVMST